MAKASFGNHSAVRVPRAQKDRIRRFYRDVLGCEVMREGEQKDDFRLGGDFYIAFMYEDEGASLDEDGFAKAIFLELKAEDPEAMRRRIVGFGVTVLDVPDPHLYFQAPGGQVFRLVGVGEDLSTYEGTEHGEQFVGQRFETRSLFEQGASVDREHQAGDVAGLARGQEQHRVADVERLHRPSRWPRLMPPAMMPTAARYRSRKRLCSGAGRTVRAAGTSGPARAGPGGPAPSG